jgi:hypothetical protein
MAKLAWILRNMANFYCSTTTTTSRDYNTIKYCFKSKWDMKVISTVYYPLSPSLLNKKKGNIKNVGLIFIHYIYMVCKAAHRQWIDFCEQDFDIQVATISRCVHCHFCVFRVVWKIIYTFKKMILDDFRHDQYI